MNRFLSHFQYIRCVGIFLIADYLFEIYRQMWKGILSVKHPCLDNLTCIYAQFKQDERNPRIFPNEIPPTNKTWVQYQHSTASIYQFSKKKLLAAGGCNRFPKPFLCAFSLCYYKILLQKTFLLTRVMYSYINKIVL